MKKNFKNIIAFIMTLLMIIPFNFGIKVSAAEETKDNEVVLFAGKATASGSWDPWETLAEIKDFKVSDFSKPFTFKIDYEGTLAPYVIFSSWSGGNTWGQVTASYFSKGTAYYTYEACTTGYGEDFSNLNQITIKPGGADTTITKVSIVPEKTSEVKINYEGMAGNIVNDINAGWNLGGSLEVFGDWIKIGTDGKPDKFETAWFNPVTTKAMIDTVKAAGFNAIRIPVTWTQHIGDEASGYKIEEEWMNRVQEVVDYAMEDGLYTIINVHHDVDGDGWLWASDNCVNNKSKKFKAVWNQIADRFKDYDNNLLFEGFNEMLDEKTNWQYPGKEATTAVNTFNQMFVDTVRKTGGNNKERCLIVNTYAASTDGNVLDDFVIPQDTRENSLIVQVHFYLPYAYANVIGEYTKQTAWKENSGKINIDGTLLNLYNHFTSKGVPVIIGEMAAANKDNLSDRAEYSRYIVNESKKYGIKCFWWDQGGKFEADSKYGYDTGMGLLNRYTLTWMYPEIVEAFTGVAPNKEPIVKGSGDVNSDGEINISDYTVLRKYINAGGQGIVINEKESDINADGEVNFFDLVALKALI
ncbi:MAG: cellulase family glycosylhydrolase [Clostridium sp.]|nr:cellulase family glycosylhydrolase [Clostridium sp.]